MKKRAVCLTLALLFLLAVRETGFCEKEAQVTNLGPQINADGDNLSPSVSRDGTTLIFSMKKTGAKNSHIYISTLKDGAWTSPEPLEALNSSRDDESPFLSYDGSIIVFSSNREGSATPKDFKGDEKHLPHDIYISYKTGGEWSKPERISDSINTTENERAPSLDRDNGVLYFTRWPGNDMDKAMIMMVQLTDDGYSSSRELEAPVNDGHGSYGFIPSKFREGYYFSSKRSGGSGSWDLYFIGMKSGKFSGAVNLGPRINSPFEDLTPAELDKDTILFASNRPGGIGRYDIYSSGIPSDMTGPAIRDGKEKDGSTAEDKGPGDGKVIKTGGGFNFRFVREGTNKPQHARFRLTARGAGGITIDPGSEVKGETDKEGLFAYMAGPGIASVLLESENGDFEPFRKEYKVDPAKVREITVLLKPKIINDAPLNEQEVLNADDFRPIYFDANSSRIKIQDYPYLYEIVGYLRKNGAVRIRIMGHSGLNGNCRSDNRISFRRARSVSDYIASFGIDRNRIIVRGYGKKYPADEKFNELNRRVEFAPVK